MSNGRRLDIGIASYKSLEKLRRTVAAIQAHSVTDWRLLIVHNPSDADGADLYEELTELADSDSRIYRRILSENKGYAGAVNEILCWAKTEYIAYLDNDAYVETEGWDEKLCQVLDRWHEVGMVFPNGGAYPIQRGGYAEIMWGTGFAWVLNRIAMQDCCQCDPDGLSTLFDTSLGHQEEADYCLRMRMAGYRCGAVPEVRVRHDATATSDPASIERINRGVIRFVDKWCRYFGGKNLNYHSPNVLRWEDWPPNALYLEEWWRDKLPASVIQERDVITVEGRQYDLVKVPRLAGFYKGRII